MFHAKDEVRHSCFVVSTFIYLITCEKLIITETVKDHSADIREPPSLPSQEDLKVWVTNITGSITEHEEILKWGQPQPTTSSTEEVTRLDGSKGDNRSERGGERSDCGERIEPADLEMEKEKERGERSERSDRGGKSESKRSEKSGKRK